MSVRKLFDVVAFLVLVVLLTVTIAPAGAQSAKAPSADWLMFEAMWTAGGPPYQAAVNKLADTYAAKMNNRCQASLDIGPAVKTYAAFTPRGTEMQRNRLIRRQIATLACITRYGREPV